MQTFLEFFDKKQRDAKKHLKVVQKLLESGGMKVKSFLGEDDPYIFLINPSKKLSFEGIRIYKIGNQMAFRVQKTEKTQPYGKAYPIDLEEMFRDFLSDHMDEQKAGKMVVKSVLSEINKFFNLTVDAEKEIADGDLDDQDPLGKMVVNSVGGDYSQQVYSKS